MVWYNEDMWPKIGLDVIRKMMKIWTGILLMKDFGYLERNWILTIGGGARKEKTPVGKAYGRCVTYLSN